MQFFFKYLSPSQAWAPLSSIDLDAFDEEVVSFSMRHTEAKFAEARLVVEARDTSYHALGRHAILAVRVAEGQPIKGIIRGVVTAMPRGLRGDFVEMEILSRRDDWESMQAELIETLAVAPQFDPLLVEVSQIRSAEEVLYGHAAVLAWNRLEGEPRISYIDRGPRTLNLDEIAYDSLDFDEEEPPLSSVTIDLVASWQQDASVRSTVSWTHGSFFDVVAHLAMQQAWPIAGADLGGNWIVEESNLRFGRPRMQDLGQVAGGYDSAIYSGKIPIYTVTSSHVRLKNKRAQARQETVSVTVTAPVQPVMGTTTDGETLTLRRVIGSGDETQPWQQTVSYDVGDLVFYTEALYECSVAHTAGTHFAPSKWTRLEGSAGRIGLSFFETSRGEQVISAAINRAAARLRYAARAARVKFTIPLDDALDFRIDDMLTISDDRLPGSTVTGKLIEFTMRADEDGGCWCDVEIGCSVGLGGSRVPSLDEVTGPAAPALGLSIYPVTGTVSPLANAQLASLREAPDAYTLEARVQIEAPAVPSTYELSRSLSVAAGILDLPKGIDL